MKLSMYSGAALVFVLSLIQPTAGLDCDSGCAACWRDGHPGVDIKFQCYPKADNQGGCGSACPDGFSNMHCADHKRCQCEAGKNCPEFGPCWCGTDLAGGVNYCKFWPKNAICGST